ncbi:solute carrier family 22 member 12-like isoform X2 [Schistocerca piceifrons]|uniref:solute carrier family 22 member 12-like isoform X2 n=1 Tax=Schistocerca piceifrons TaxID=274613 RepID=UPI001F5FC2ED|nr:solute carrier family 22 member 12-like isoform X2 [Schistocerca piceifrons]
MSSSSTIVSGSLSVGQQELEENEEISKNRRNPKVALAFEEVLDSIGSRGKFQTRLNIVFNCFGPCFNMMSVNVFFLAMQTPDHWCHVPGREHVNVSLEEWKNFTIPRAGNSFSKCLMYNQSDAVNWSSAAPIKCQHGWDYDETWFSLTVPSQMNWVCDNQQPAKDVLFYAQNIGVAMSLLFGYIGDMYGRRPLQLFCLVTHVISRLLLVLTPDILVLFILAESIVSAAAGPMLESTLSVGLELADIRHRTTLNYISSCCLGVGFMAAGFLSWLLRNWNYFMYCTAALFFTLILFSRSAHLLTQFSLVLLAGGVGVNPFLTVVAQGAVQLPSGSVVHVCAARFGRRWTAVGCALLAGVTCAATFCMLRAGIIGLAITVMAAITQFFTTGTITMANLQSVEVHPTCLRQIAACVEWAVAGVVMSAVPYVALMSDRRTPYAIIAALNLGTAFAISFLPESALQRLPESLQDAAVFGKDQKYWSWKPKPALQYPMK